MEQESGTEKNIQSEKKLKRVDNLKKRDKIDADF